MISVDATRNCSAQIAVQLMDDARCRFHTMTTPTVKWKVFRECNYRCPYCTVWQDRSEDPPGKLASAYAAAVTESFPPPWRIYLTGGELTARKRPTETIIRKLAERGHELRIISNFSAPISYYVKLHEMSQGLLRSIFVTRHRCYAALDGYTRKIEGLRRALPASCSILARQVVDASHDGICDFLLCRRHLASIGIELYPLRLVTSENKQKVRMDYGQLPFWRLAEKVFASYPDFPNRKGTYCPAGFEYAYVSPSLNVYACIPYQKRKDGYLGNCLQKTVKMKRRPMFCEADSCYCVPGR